MNIMYETAIKHHSNPESFLTKIMIHTNVYANYLHIYKLI